MRRSFFSPTPPRTNVSRAYSEAYQITSAMAYSASVLRRWRSFSQVVRRVAAGRGGVQAADVVDVAVRGDQLQSRAAHPPGGPNEFRAMPPKLTKHSMPGSSSGATLRSHRSQSRCHRQPGSKPDGRPPHQPAGEPLARDVPDRPSSPGLDRRRVISFRVRRPCARPRRTGRSAVPGRRSDNRRDTKSSSSPR